MKRVIAAVALALLAFGTAAAQNIGTSEREVGDRYRFVWLVPEGADSLMIRFPNPDVVDSMMIPVGADSIRSAMWLFISDIGDTAPTGPTGIQEFVVYSGAYPGGFASYWISDKNDHQTVGGMSDRIDSVLVAKSGDRTLQIEATD